MNKVQMHKKDARIMYNALNGIFVAYKPTDLPFIKVRGTIITNLCRDLNQMYVRPPMNHVFIEGPTNAEMKVYVRPSFADYISVVGPRYQEQDFRLAATNIMKSDTCGVMVCGINSGNNVIHKLRENKPTRFYRVKGELGRATATFFHTGKIVERSVYKHVTRGHIDRLCSTMQSSHQRKMFELCGVDMESQAAYELAVKGLLRPADPKIPMLYTIKCVDFKSPEFTLEIVSINENEMYLKEIIHELGLKLKTNATCTQILCLQDGLFNLSHALLSKHWTVENILGNMRVCQNILSENPDLLNQESPTLVEPNCDTPDVPLIDSPS